MQLNIHLCGPLGEATRREIAHALNLLRMDNMYWITAQLNSGNKVPCCSKRAGIVYLPPTPEEAETPVQEFYCAQILFEERDHPVLKDQWGRPLRLKYGACGDIAGYDSAALTVLYKQPTEVMVPAQGVTSYHAEIMTPRGPYDPTKKWSETPCRCPRSSGLPLVD